MTSAQAVELRHETRSSTEPALVFLDHLGARAILADHERIAELQEETMSSDAEDGVKLDLASLIAGLFVHTRQTTP